ncbi:ABC transporter ATP-binding protein [Luethyella okanaganae]|uniref:ABC transporter ATP-binding protein n=1 Tax=Luethyella okanaganae TaxID=69372 RepID=A0ABW1VHA3_9MICO
MPLLSATAVTRDYAISTTLWQRPRIHRGLDRVSLTIAAGERVGLVGSSGSGKSTLLRAILAIDPIDAGDIRFDGRTIRPGPVRALRWYRRLVQYVPQDPASSLDPRMSVRTLVAEPLRRLRVPGDHDAVIDEALGRVGLGNAVLDRRPAQLSGGQAQRVALARAIATRPRLLVADEPVSGLDLPLRNQVMDVLHELCHGGGMALLMVSHDLTVVAGACERTAVMSHGRIVEDRATTDLLSSPRHDSTRALLAAIPTLPHSRCRQHP